MRPARPARLVLRLAGAALAAWLGAGTAGAQDLAVLRASCEPLMTVVREGCEVQNTRRCPDGTLFTESLSPDGGVSVEMNDAEGGVLYSIDLVTAEGWLRTLETQRAFSLSELLETGSSSGSYVAELRWFFAQSRPGRTFIDARLTGETRRIGDVTFLVGSAEMGMEMGVGGNMAVALGPILVDAERRLITTDAGTMSFNGATMPTGDAVLDVLLPGDPGFMADAPLEQCGPQLSKAPR